MVFSSHLFIFYFLPLALLGYYLLPRRGQHVFLTLVSYLFYGWANPLFVVLMLVSSLIDYIAGLAQTGQLDPGAWSKPVPLLAPIDSSVRPPPRWYNWLLVPYVVGWLRLETPGRTLGQKLALLAP